MSLKVLQSFGNDELAKVYIGITKEGSWVEFVESLQPPLPRKDKWVLIVSTMDGCPIKCGFCDAGGSFRRNLTREEIMDQIHYMVARRFTDTVDVAKFKVQFARIGEPSLNPSVLGVLEELDERYDAPGLLPSVSSIAPLSSESFFERLLEIKSERYTGRFQLQFSVHSTDREQRDSLIPVKKWGLEKIADYGSRFCGEHDRKVTLNFALSSGSIIEPEVITSLFDPAKFLVKITPVNPTYSSRDRKLDSAVDDDGSLIYHQRLVDKLRSVGFDVLVSVGEPEENRIGSNCGLYIRRHLSGSSSLSGAYALVKKDTT